MLFVVSAMFKPGAAEKLGPLQSAFNTHLMQTTPRIHLGGALHDEQGAHIGVFFVIEASAVEQVHAMSRESAYTKAGIYDRIEVNRLDLEIGHLV